MPTTVGVFIDWQNCYNAARNALGFQGPGIEGNVNPLSLARWLASNRLAGQEPGTLTKVRIHAGMASQKRDSRTYAANQRQFQAWRNLDPSVEVLPRMLDYSLGRPREKGVDVALAIDVVRRALIDHECDVAVVVTADTDLLPALELVVEQGGPTAVEAATWTGPNWSPKPLGLAHVQIRQHRMDGSLYQRIADRTDYNQPTRPRR